MQSFIVGCINWILKKRNIWFHIIVGYCTGGIWLLIYFGVKYYKKYYIDIKKENENKTKITNEVVNPSFNITFEFDSHKPRKKSLYSKTKTHKLVDDYVVFDLETTGLNNSSNEIIEISALKYNNNVLVDKFSKLVKPQECIPAKITKITGITNEMVENSPSIDEVLPQFIKFIDNYTLVAHNGSFDLGFIENNLCKLNLPLIENKNIDTLYLAREKLPELENHKLETLKEFLNINFDSHRAESDCLTTNEVYQYCKK